MRLKQLHRDVLYKTANACLMRALNRHVQCTHIRNDKTPTTEMPAFRSPPMVIMIYMHAAPSMPRTLPLIHSPSCEARKQTTRAMSMGRPTRWSGDQPAAY